jgi:hypothetical protein
MADKPEPTEQEREARAAIEKQAMRKMGIAPERESMTKYRIGLLMKQVAQIKNILTGKK